MKRGTKIVLALVGIAVVGGGITAVRLLGSDGSAEILTVEVKRDTIVRKALAVGHIEPDVEVEVKSQVAGVVGRLMVEEGAFVAAGQPLLEVRPNPTPIELADAKRQVQLREIDLRARRVHTIAGTGQRGSNLRAGPGREVALRSPWALARQGNTLFVAMAGAHQIWVFDIESHGLAPYAGSGRENIDDGPLKEASFSPTCGPEKIGSSWAAAVAETRPNITTASITRCMTESPR